MIPADFLLPERPLTEEESSRLAEKLLILLAGQAERYCMGEHSSIPEETAGELLSSLCFTLQLELEASALTVRDLLEQDLFPLLRAGQKRLEERLAAVKSLWNQVYALAEPTGNRETLEALHLLAAFCKRYDLYFFAHQTPWDMGIPLSGPELAQRGLPYAEAYLTGLHQYLLRAAGPD